MGIFLFFFFMGIVSLLFYSKLLQTTVSRILLCYWYLRMASWILVSSFFSVILIFNLMSNRSFERNNPWLDHSETSFFGNTCKYNFTNFHLDSSHVHHRYVAIIDFLFFPTNCSRKKKKKEKCDEVKFHEVWKRVRRIFVWAFVCRAEKTSGNSTLATTMSAPRLAKYNSQFWFIRETN